MTDNLTPEAVALVIAKLKSGFDNCDRDSTGLELGGVVVTMTEAADMLEALAAKLAEVEEEKREMAMQSLAALGQAHDAYEAQLAAEAEVARLRNLVRRAQKIIDPCFPARSLEWQNDARAILQGENQ